MAQEDSRQEGRRAERWARVNFPNKFVHPHEYTARDGRVFDKMFVSIPPGVTLNGVDLGGYAFDHFAKPREIEQKANGRPVAINFRPGEPVRLFRGVGPERRTLEISNPWDLCRAVKAHNDEYARSRQEAAAMSAEASQARGAAGGADRPTSRTATCRETRPTRPRCSTRPPAWAPRCEEGRHERLHRRPHRRELRLPGGPRDGRIRTQGRSGSAHGSGRTRQIRGRAGPHGPVGLQDRRVLEGRDRRTHGIRAVPRRLPAGGRQPPVPRGGRRVAFGSARRRQGRGLGRMLGGG